MDSFDELARCDGFEWDVHNAGKNWPGYRVSPAECEEIFFNRPIVSGEDMAHSGKEARFYVLGHTDAGRMLFIVFTVRKNRIWVISARDMNRKERNIYENFEGE
jgi:uncharacterized protein